MNVAEQCETLPSPTQMPRMLRVAIQHALGAQGASVVLMPGDIADLPAAHPGFAMAAGKTVLAGGVGKMLEMARSNLRNVRAL